MRDEPQAGQRSIRRSPAGGKTERSYHGTRRPRSTREHGRSPKPAADATPEASAAAKAAGLRYTTNAKAGIRRLGAPPRSRYVGPDGKPVRDAATLQRIKALVIPPAWTGVWIAPDPSGHLQATGRDARGRKQYRYHPKWRQTRDETKFDRMIPFGYSLPQIRQRTERDLTLLGLSRPKVLAAVVQLLERTLIRVGNDEYARANDSYGLTTLRDKHVRVNGTRVRFAFRGKSGIDHALDVSDRRLAAVVRRCRDLPGQELFQYLDEDGAPQDVGSGDVNEYLREITGEEFTSKDFRTWAGTVLAAEALRACGPCRTGKDIQREIVRAIDRVAERLGNTRAVCRRCYVHPAVLEAFEGGSLSRAFARRAGRGSRPPARLGEAEVAILRLLESAR